MDWTRYVDGYCERVDPSYWSEPTNAVTNAAFLVAAIVMWRRVYGLGLPLASAQVVLLAAIGVGSFLFHTHATVWAAAADTTPIALFILVYLYAANRHYWELRPVVALLGTLAFFPYAIFLTMIFRVLPFFEISSFYWPVALLIAGFAAALRRRSPATSNGLAIGAGLLVVSLIARSIDEILCNVLPVGTHFLWHLLNGLMLGWMIEVYRRHMLAARLAQRRESPV